MQRTLVNKLYTLLESRRDVVYLTADNGTDYDVLLFSAFPEQCVNMGIAEENMVAVAAGMAMCGKTPILCSSGAFLAYRAYEFIRNDVCFQNQNVKIIGLGSGLSISALGPTHHTTEDFAALRAIPNLTILSASTPTVLEQVLDRAMALQGPVYVRLGMRSYGEIGEFTDDTWTNGLRVLRRGTDVLVFATGDMVPSAVAAAEQLQQEHNIEAEVVDVVTLKPLNREAILCCTNGHRHIFCAEEHNVIGGLGETIADALNAEGVSLPVHKFGLEDTFAAGYGSQSQLQAHNGLSPEALYRHILREVAK